MAEEDDGYEETANAPSNYETFRDCLSEIVIQHLAPASTSPKRKKRGTKIGRKNGAAGSVSPDVTRSSENNSDAEDLGDFIDYLAHEIYSSLPSDLQTLSYASTQNDPDLSAIYTPPLTATTLDNIATHIPPSSLESLHVYGLLSDPEDLNRSILDPLLTAYTTATTAAPPAFTPFTRANACEICARDWIPLTYHHLIPRSTHARVLKRGWHEEWQLNSVAWLCRACHSMVHRLEGNEELARNWFTVERLIEREEVRRFASWVGGVRWKAR